MYPISDIKWGSVDADQDDTLPQTFVSSPHIKSLIDEAIWIITGEKGSGKTAIKRAFTDPRLKVVHPYQVVGSIDFDELQFETFQDHLMGLAKVAVADPLRLLINFWIFTLITESARCLEAHGFNHESEEADLLSLELDQILHKSKDSPGSRFRKLIKLPVELFINEQTSAKAQDYILAFTLEYRSFKELKDAALSFLHLSNRKMILVLDGFDSVCTLTRDPIYNSVIFEALCEAVVKLRHDESLRQKLHFKVLLPHDRFLPMLLRGVGESPVRDAVKIRDLHGVLSWRRDRLVEFAEKRITATVGRQFSPGDALAEILPKSVVNSHYTSIEENSFDYILRHTMWRPRHVQQHMVKLSREYNGELIDQRRLKVSVAKTCQDLVQEFIEEYSIDHPNISSFIRMFNGQHNVIPFETLTGILSSALAKFDGSKKWTGKGGFNQKLEALYRMGFFGIVNEIEEGCVVPPDIDYLPPSKLHGRRYFVEFYYHSSAVEPVHLRVSQATQVAIHPIFFNHCQMKPHSSIIVG